MRRHSKACVVKEASQKSNSSMSKVNFNPKLLPAWQRTPPLTKEKRASLLQEHRERVKLMKRDENLWKRNERKCFNMFLGHQHALDIKQEELYNKEREMLMKGTLKHPALPANPAPWGYASPGIRRCFPDTEKEEPAFPRAEKEEEKLPKP